MDGADAVRPQGGIGGSAARIVEAAQELGPISILVNNVGGNVGAGHFIDSDPDTWQADLDITLMTTLRAPDYSSNAL